MVVEFAAARLFAPWFGASLPVWANVIGVVLAALAAGAWVGGRAAGRGAGAPALALVLLLAGALSWLTLVAGPRLAAALLPVDADPEGVPGLLARASLVATAVVFAPPMALLGAVSPLGIAILARGRGAGRAAGAVVGLGTAGSIAGTFAAVHLLLPSLGTRGTLLAAGAALVACAAALAAFPGGRPRRGGAALVATLLVLVPAARAATGPFRPEPATSSTRVVAEADGAYQFAQVREEDEPAGDRTVRVRRLTLNEGKGTYHSVWREGSVLTGGRYYDLYPALPLLARPEPGRLEVGILGLAAGTQARALRHFLPEGTELRVDGVEIDPAVIELARAHMELPAGEPWLRVHAMDARAFLRTAPPERRYDLLLVDCYAQEHYIPFHMATVEFFREARARLRPGGILAFNAFGYRGDDPLLRALVRTCATAFGRAWRIAVPGYPNWIVLASEGGDDPGLDAFAAAADSVDHAAFAARPEGREALRTASRAIRSAVAFLPEEGGLVLTDDRAPLERLMDEALAREEGVRLGTAPGEARPRAWAPLAPATAGTPAEAVAESRALLRAGDLPRARALLAAAAERSPGDAAVAGALGALLEEEGDAAGAIEVYGRALAAGPGGASLASRRAWAMVWGTGEFARARDEGAAELRRLAGQPGTTAALASWLEGEAQAVEKAAHRREAEAAALRRARDNLGLATGAAAILGAAALALALRATRAVTGAVAPLPA